MIDEDVSFAGIDRRINAFLVRPELARDATAPAVIVIHEIWGLDDHIRDVARRFAREGFVALAPDMYSGALKEAMSPENIMAGMKFLREAPPEVQRDPSLMRSRLEQLSPDERRALTTLMDVMSPDRRTVFARDLVRAVEYLRARPDTGLVGSLGFCFGGGLSARLATLSKALRACVIFYGENPPLDRVSEIVAPVLGIYGGEDPRITDTVPAFAAAMEAAHKTFEYHVYPGARHAFFNDTRPMYDKDAAADAWTRSLSFLHRELDA